MECKQCGYCCKEEICQIGEMVFGIIEPPCPALVKENELYFCSFVVAENDFFVEPILTKALGIGIGCDRDK